MEYDPDGWLGFLVCFLSTEEKHRKLILHRFLAFTLNISLFNRATKTIGPFQKLNISKKATVAQLKQETGALFEVIPDSLRLCEEPYTTQACKELQNDDTPLASLYIRGGEKVCLFCCLFFYFYVYLMNHICAVDFCG